MNLFKRFMIWFTGYPCFIHKWRNNYPEAGEHCAKCGAYRQEGFPGS